MSRAGEDRHEYYDPDYKGRVIRTGGRPDCAHEAQIDTGRGCSSFLTKCADCGASFQYLTGNDPFLAAEEASHEPPW